MSDGIIKVGCAMAKCESKKKLSPRYMEKSSETKAEMWDGKNMAGQERDEEPEQKGTEVKTEKSDVKTVKKCDAEKKKEAKDEESAKERKEEKKEGDNE